MTPEEKMKLCANGNQEAESFMIATHEFLHKVDDIFDKDKEVTAEEFSKATLHFIIHLADNPFFRLHKDRLMVLIEHGIAAWLDSDKAKFESAKPFLKRQYHEIFWECARLTGGWPLMRQIQTDHRNFED